MHISAFVTWLLSAFVATTFLLQWWRLPAYPSWLWAGIAVTGLVAAAVTTMLRMQTSGGIILASLSGIVLSLFAVTHATPAQRSSDIARYATGQTVFLVGQIVEAPDRRQTSVRYTVRTESLSKTDYGTGTSVTGLALITQNGMWPRAELGDRIRVHGTLEHPGGDNAEGYDNYLSLFGITATLRTNSVAILGTGHVPLWQRILTNLNDRTQRLVITMYPEPHAALLSGILTGSRQGFSRELTDTFKRVGLTHIVAVSGYNIAIVITVISTMLFFLPLRWRLLPSVAAIIAFTFFVGASASVVRAAIMGILGLLALHTGRKRNVRLTVLWTAALMTLWNPLSLWYDAGFQLSFLSVLGLTELKPFYDRYETGDSFLGWKESLILTMAAQLFAVPWSMYLFGELSLIAPVANVLVAPFIPLAMLLGALSLLAGTISIPLAVPIAACCWLALEWVIRTATYLSMIPLASLQTGSPHPAFIVGYYLLLVGAIAYTEQWPRLTIRKRTASPVPTADPPSPFSPVAVPAAETHGK